MDKGEHVEGCSDSPKEKFLNTTVSEEDESSQESDRSAGTKELAVVPQEKNWKGIFLSIVVIGIVCIIVGVSAWLLQPPETSDNYKYIYDFDSMFDMSWRPYVTNGHWIRDSFVYRDKYFNVVSRTGEDVQILVSNDTMEILGISQATVSPDFKYALLAYNVQKVFRYSTTAEYYIHDIETGSHVEVHDGPVQHAAWGSTGSQLAYVVDSDLYYKSNALAPPVSITKSAAGTQDSIQNGITDWIYEEEMFSGSVAHWFSTEGSYLSYVSFNDTSVQEVDIVVYNLPYPKVEKIHYPKAGSVNPTVELNVYNLKAEKKLRILPPDSLKTMEILINSFVWISDNTALVTWSNRYQNISSTMFCSVPKEFTREEIFCEEIYHQTADGWIEHIGKPPVPGPGKTYFQIEEKPLGGKGKFHHLLMVNYSTSPSTTKFLTSGNWEVTKVLQFDAILNRIFYLSTERSPMDRHLYSVSVLEDRPVTVCHTCQGSCKYAEVSFSPTAPRALLNCKGPGVPHSALLDLTGQSSIMLEDNNELKEKVREAKLPDVIVDTVTINGEDGVYEFQTKLYLPPNIKLKKNVPLLVDIYAGPGSQKVDSRFLMDWTTYLTTNKDIAVLTFDGRGSGFRGSKAMKEVNRRLGMYEIEDHIIAIKQTISTHPYLSQTKIGIWGWSYGGYASALVATHPMSLATNLTKCVISVAPVTDWRLYDSVYTERYMGSPNININHYTESSLLPKAHFFNNFQYLLVHGTRDDNVHFQNSAVLEMELVRAGVVHRYQVYTDETHSLSSEPRYTLRHFYKMMTQFLTECYHDT